MMQPFYLLVLALQWTATCCIHTAEAGDIGLQSAVPDPRTPPLYFNNSARRLRREFDPEDVADDELWRKYVKKGNDLLCAMRATDKGAGFLLDDQRKPPSAASPWKGDLRSELKLWGWNEHPLWWDDAALPCDYEEDRMGPALLGFGLNPKPKYAENSVRLADGENECTAIYHRVYRDFRVPMEDQKYTVDGKVYYSSNAHYKFGMNVRDGGIIVESIFSPKHCWGSSKPLSEYPKLRYCSDVLMGYWHRNNPNIKGLRVFVAQDVINTEATLLLGRAFKNKGIDYIKPWPGHSFDTNTDEGKALLGSPIGAIMANMLIRNKLDLGIKHITRVTAVSGTSFPKDHPRYEPFYDEPDGDWVNRKVHLFYLIENVPDAQLPKDEDDKEKSPDDGDKPKDGGKPTDRQKAVSEIRSKTSSLVAELEDGDNILRIHKVEISV